MKIKNRKHLVIGTFTMVGDSELHQEPNELEFIKGREVAFVTGRSDWGNEQTYKAYIKDDSTLGQLCPADEALVSKRFWITLHVEEFSSGFKYIVIDEVEPYCNVMDEDNPVEDFLDEE